jgi:hypothetical protein
MINRVRYQLHKLKKRLLWPFRKRFPKFINQIDDPRNAKLLCQSCGTLVPFKAYHIGFSSFYPLYCDSCPDVLLLEDYLRFPYGSCTNSPSENAGKNWLPGIHKVDSTLPKCKCGGSFAYMNPPRCPHCLGLVQGDLYAGKPVMKGRDRYTFVSRQTFKIDELQTTKNGA